MTWKGTGAHVSNTVRCSSTVGGTPIVGSLWYPSHLPWWEEGAERQGVPPAVLAH